jgi:lysophospholipase L1-like esterase
MADSGTGRRWTRALGAGLALRTLRTLRGPRGRRRLVAAVTGLALLIVAAGPLGGAAAIRCRVFGAGCQTAATPLLEPPRLRPRSALDIATQGGYVALGDSYSAGEGAYEIPADLAPGNRCHRTSRAYFHEISGTFRFRAGSAFWACSGATTGDVLRGEDGEPPQITRVTADTSLVTLSVGGNDAGFARVLAGCVVRFPWSKGCQGQGGEIETRLRSLRADLAEVLNKIVRAAPLARVIVVGYPRIFSETSGRDFDNITVGDQRWLNIRARELDSVIWQVAQAADQRIVAAHGAGSVEFVDAFYAFAGHEIGSEDPFVNGLDINLSALSAEARSFHPNAGGYRRLAQVVSRQIINGPGRAILQYR